MPEEELYLIIHKEINAPVADVYSAWTQPELLSQWFVPDNSMIVKKAEVELSVGGQYLIHVYDLKEKTDHIVSGTYDEIIPNQKIVFNWMWQDGVDRTEVTVEFEAKTEGFTMLTLTHRGFSQQQYAERHNEGWAGCLNTLAAMF